MNRDLQWQLWRATDRGDATEVRNLLQEGADPCMGESLGERSALGRACIRGKLEVVQVILAHEGRLDQYADCASLLESAITSDEETGDDILALLLQAEGARIALQTSDADSLLGRAVRHRSAASLQRLIELGAGLETRDHLGWTPLLNCALAEDPVGAYGVLAAAGADLSARGPNNGSAIFIAVRSHALELVRHLAELGADLGEVRDGEITLLHEVFLLSHERIVASREATRAALLEFLLERNPEHLFHATMDGALPFHLAAAEGSAGCLENMLRRGVDVNVVTATGLTALHGAAAEGRLGAVTTLLAYGADPEMTCEAGKLPEHCAHGYDEVADVLRRARELRTLSRSVAPAGPRAAGRM